MTCLFRYTGIAVQGFLLTRIEVQYLYLARIEANYILYRDLHIADICTILHNWFRALMHLLEDEIQLSYILI